MDYGAILTELWVPDRNGTLGNVVAGFDNLDQYLAGQPFFGATTGRFANRIAKGAHLAYTSADQQYVLIGTPVEIVEERKGSCTLTVGTTATFNRATETAKVEGSTGGIPIQTTKLKACPAELVR